VHAPKQGCQMAEEGKKGAVSAMKYLSLYGEKGGRHTF